MVKRLGLHRQQCKNALLDLLQRPLSNLLTVLVLALSLSLPTTFFMLAKNIVMMKDELQPPNQLTIYLKKLSANNTKNYVDALERWPSISSAQYISPEEGLQELRKMQGFQSAVDLLEDNPLPGVILVTPAQQGVKFATDLAKRLGKESEIEEVRLNSDWLTRISAIESLALSLSMAFSGLMLVAVFFIIGNTLRLQIVSHKEQIQVMKLVGATNSYILRPYVYMGMWLALVGALLAWLVTLLVSNLLSAAVLDVAVLYQSDFKLSGLNFEEIVMLLIFSAILGIFAAKLAAGKHLVEIEPV
ncbi:MAG: permease-like cell division protein FtsX [Vibrionaceae bacterium]